MNPSGGGGGQGLQMGVRTMAGQNGDKAPPKKKTKKKKFHFQTFKGKQLVK